MLKLHLKVLKIGYYYFFFNVVKLTKFNFKISLILIYFLFSLNIKEIFLLLLKQIY